jgi:hypothetical protein
MSTTEFKDGSKIEFAENGEAEAFVGKTAVSVYALATAKAFLGLEIRHPGMKMSRHGSALNLAENLSGMSFGRGVKGRQKALDWVEAELARIKSDETA